jgi:hypothetical protein
VVGVVVVLCFVKSRNGLLVRLSFFFFESNTSRGSLVVLVEFIYVASFVVCEFEEFFEWVSSGRACGFLLCCGVFFCSSRPPRSLSRGADLGGDLEVSDRRRSVSFVLLEGEGFVDFAPEVL